MTWELKKRNCTGIVLLYKKSRVLIFVRHLINPNKLIFHLHGNNDSKLIGKQRDLPHPYVPCRKGKQFWIYTALFSCTYYGVQSSVFEGCQFTCLTSEFSV